MGRAYAGLLGPLAFLTTVLHALVHSVSAEVALGWAAAALFAFAALGFLAGELASWIVEDSVRSSLQSEQQRSAATAPKATAARQS